MKTPTIFFSDLDGTLLNDQKIITPKTKEAIEAYTAAGNRFVICTGRPLSSALTLFDQLGLPDKGSYIISYNGAQIYDCGAKKLIVNLGLDIDEVRALFALAEEMGVYIQTYNNTDIVCRVYDKHTEHYVNITKMSVVVNDDPIEALTDPATGEVLRPAKLLAVELTDKARIDAFKDEVLKRYGDHLSVLYSNPLFLEVFSSQAGKGNAVKSLCQHLGIPIENSISAGDMDNDYSMLEVTGRSVCMINGTDSLKAIATDITSEDNNHDGLVPYLVP
ncbi:MAG: HAD family phosphatase [Lachnospiraceae bacterium]|nr:HAD family phosphatase [Candidatus Equihabitans merdae]